MSEITMPRLSDTMQEGTISRWLKQPGDEVKKGDVLAEIETDKATMDLEAYESGTLEKILVQGGGSGPDRPGGGGLGSWSGGQKGRGRPSPAAAPTPAARPCYCQDGCARGPGSPGPRR